MTSKTFRWSGKTFPRQRYFDFIVTLLAEQGRSDNGDGCLYRGPDGKVCAAGPLIPNKLYKPSFEGQGFGGVIRSTDNNLPKDFTSKFTLESIYFIRDLQCAHDQNEHNKWSEFIKNFTDVADRYNLDKTVLKSLRKTKAWK